MMHNTEASCCYLEWDSDFFGYRIARARPSRLTQEDLEHIRQWSRIHQIDCVYILVDAADATTVRLAETYGLRLVDVRVTFEKRIVPTKTVCVKQGDVPLIRKSRDSDISSLQKIARASHRDTRFYYDGHFPALRCDDLYGVWIEKSCRGYA